MKISNKQELSAAIIELERIKVLQEEELILQFKATRKMFTPFNLMKDGIKQMAEGPGLQNTLLKTAAGVGVAFLSKGLIGGKSSLLKKVLTGAVELGVAGSAVSHIDQIKAYGISIYHNLFKKQKNKLGQVHDFSTGKKEIE
jgi:uncharacterized membrane protein